MNSRVKIAARLNFLLLTMLMVFGAVIGRLYYLHVIGQETLMSAVERSRNKFEILHASRGKILDSRGTLLGGTRSVVDIGVDPQAVREIDMSKLGELAKILGIGEEELRSKFEKKIERCDEFGIKEYNLVRWKKLAGSVSDRTYEEVMKLKIKGVYGNRRFERYYPQGRLGAHILGFINKENQAVCGVERYMDFYLKEQDGWIETEKDGKRKELSQYRKREVRPKDGLNVQLSLDVLVQYEIEKEIDRIVKEYDPRGISIVVSQPETGYILGMANYPSYNPNNFWEYEIDSHRNRAVTDLYEPGSPFKVVTASGVLNEGILKLDEEYDCAKDRVEYKGRIVKLPKDHKPYGILTAAEVIKKSSNRGVAQMAMKLGEEKLIGYIKSFGFGKRLGWGIDLEGKGQVHEIKNWDGLTIGRLPMGHAVSCTALQMNAAMAVIANKGILMKPQVIKSVVDGSNEIVEEYKPQAIERVLKEEVARQMMNLLEEVVGPDGTSGKAAIKGISVAGKSGTSQKVVNGAYSQKHHVSSFSGFFPADEPKVVMTIVIDEAKKAGVAYGGLVAAPSFKNIGTNLVQCMNIEPNLRDQKMLCDKTKSFLHAKNF